jgi:protein involved in polysaccharide export with SLBB domain
MSVFVREHKKDTDSSLLWKTIGSILFVLAIVVFSSNLASAQSEGAVASSQAPAASGDAQGAVQTSADAPDAQAPSENDQALAPSSPSANSPAHTQSANSHTANAHHAPSAKAPIPTHEDLPVNVQRPSPYGDLASLRDLYTQVPTAGGKLTRFGSDTFLLGTGNTDELPMDLPVGPDYVLGPGDNIILNLWGGRSIRLNVTIDRQGQIALPEAGSITLNGLTIAQAQSAIQKSLNTQYQGEHVEISLGRLRTVRIYVVGDVQRPGAYDVSSLSTPLSALYAAGGPTARGSMRLLRQYRGNQLVREIDLYDFLLRGVRSDNERLLPGDTLLVPAVGSQVTVEGMVHRPAIYELNGEQTLDQVLNLAGGVLATASLKQINVERLEAHEHRTMLSLQLSGKPDAVKQQIVTFKVQGGDDISISQILPYNEQAVYVEGHVYRPGKYPYRDGMTISDLLHSYQDVLPEPSDHAELIRLQPPLYSPETKSFNLHEVLIGNDSFTLMPFDLIRIFSRYELDAPTVTITGEVLRPGIFPMHQGMTISQLIEAAGGFKRSAFRTEADLSSYTTLNGTSIQIDHKTVDLDKVLGNDRSENLELKPGDVLNIRQLEGWQDIGATVTITGEVEHPGGYGIISGERLSSVLKRAGGFRQQAYPEAADFERTQVRELNTKSRLQMIQRIESTPITIKSGTMTLDSENAARLSLQQQRDQILTSLRNQPANGRLVVNLSPDISKWENTPADLELRAGDTLEIPKRPNFVLISGQVFNPTAISYIPGRTVSWYLNKAGGQTSAGNKKQVYVLRADGSIVIHGDKWGSSGILNAKLRPGDTIFVPEKIVGASPVWQNILGAAQIMTAAVTPLALSGVL